MYNKENMDLNYQTNIYGTQMNNSWHIPRASLNGSVSGSSASSNQSNSNPPTVTRHSNHLHPEGHTNYGYVHNERPSRKAHGNKRDQIYGHHFNFKSRNNTPTADRDGGSGLKRGSRSSQGSTDSTHSSHSASSGSLLLTAANLERFVAIHNKQQQQQQHTNPDHYLGDKKSRNHPNYDNNLKISTNTDGETIQNDLSSKKCDAIIEIDPNLNFVKTKDVDAVSIASSTHFTMVNGIGGPQKPKKEGICSRGHQITVLILTMSMFFLIGILAMVYLLEMRAREMPQQ